MRLEAASRAPPERARSMRAAAGGAPSSSVADRLDAEQRRAGVDLHVAGDEHVAHPPGDRRGDADLHLHRLDDDRGGRRRRRRRPGATSTRDHERGGRRPHDAGVVAGEAVGDAVDLDEVVAALDRRHDARTSGRRSSAGCAPRPRRSTSTTAATPSSSTLEARRAELARRSTRYDWPPWRSSISRPIVVVGLRAAAAGPAEEAAPLEPRPAARRRRARRRRGRRRRGGSAGARRRRSAGRATPCRPSPARTSGRSSRSSRNDLFVVPPRTTTVSLRRAPGAAGRAPRRGRGRGR